MDGQILHYEELRGSTGRRAYFRAKRHHASDLFASPLPRVCFADGQVWQLSDISLRGMAVMSNDAQHLSIGIGETTAISLVQGETVLFEGMGTVRWIETFGDVTKLALNFQTDFIDISAVRRRDAQARMRANFVALRPASNDEVSTEYRVLCADTLAMLRSYRVFLEERCDMTVEHRIGGELDGAFELCVEQLMPEWHDLWKRGNVLTAQAARNPEHLRALKSTTELLLTPEFCYGPIWKHGYMKPHGYPGDYCFTEHVFNWTRGGATAYAQLLHRLGLDASEHVRGRAALACERIVEATATHDNADPVRLLNIGCGPACEASALLSGIVQNRVPLHLMLVDHDDDALQRAYETCAPLRRANPARAQVTCRNETMPAILNGALDSTAANRHDVVYSLGVFEHLDEARARDAAKALFKHVKPGGLMVLSTMNDTAHSALWPMECLMNWRMYYRIEAEMLRWADGLMKQAAWTECDATGRSRLLFVRKAG